MLSMKPDSRGTMSYLIVSSEKDRYLRDHVVLTDIEDEKKWQDRIESLCIVAILESVLAGAEVPHLGRNIKDGSQLCHFLPGALGCCASMPNYSEFLDSHREKIFDAYRNAYEQVSNLFPWLEQDYIDAKKEGARC